MELVDVESLLAGMVAARKYSALFGIIFGRMLRTLFDMITWYSLKQDNYYH